MSDHKLKYRIVNLISRWILFGCLIYGSTIQGITQITRTLSANSFFEVNMINKLSNSNIINVLSGSNIYNNIEAYISNDDHFLDSIHVNYNFGDFSEKRKWYFRYNSNHKLMDAKRLYFTPGNSFKEIIETRTYNENGRINTVIVEQLHRPFNNQYFTYDSAWVTTSKKQNVYDNNKLIHQSTINYRIYYNRIVGEDTSAYFYEYNDTGKPILEIQKTYRGIDTTKYYYNANGRLQYELNIRGSQVHKYEYEMNDTSFITTKFSTLVFPLPQLSEIDSISNWDATIKFTEVYDDQERVKSVTREGTVFQTFIGLGYPVDSISRVEYEYTNKDQILHAKFFVINDNKEWKEVQRITNTYGVENNLIHHEKTFYDDQYDEWKTELEETYYYSSNPVIVNASKTEQARLSIYPNPANNQIFIDPGIPINYHISIYNQNGEMVMNERQKSKSIPIHNLHPGIYYIILRTDNKILQGKFLKSKNP